MASPKSLQAAEASAFIGEVSNGQQRQAKARIGRRTAGIVGALFLFSNLTFLVGAFAFVEPLLAAPEYLSQVYASRSQVIVGVLLELVNGVAYMGIAVLMYAIFRHRFRSLALAYVALRIVEFVMQTLSDLSPLALLTLSEEFVLAGAPADSAFQVAGTLLLVQRYWAFQMVSIMLALGALLFYTMLYRTRLIPRWLSAWGLLGAVTVLTTTMLEIFALDVSTVIGVVLGVPMLLNELFLGLWLIVKGFNQAAITSPADMQRA